MDRQSRDSPADPLSPCASLATLRPSPTVPVGTGPVSPEAVILPSFSATHPMRSPVPAPQRPALTRRNAIRNVVLNFFFRHVPPLQAALWQRRSEPVKALRCAPTADAAPAAALTEPSAPLPAARAMKREHSTKEIWVSGECSPSCTQIAPRAGSKRGAANHAIANHQQHSLRRQQWHHQQQRRAAQEKCGAAEPQQLSLSAAHHAERQPHPAPHQAGRGLPHGAA